MNGASTSPRVQVLNTQVSATTFREAIDFLASMVNRGEGSYISCANAYSLTLALDNPAYQKVLNGAAFVTADGMPIVWVIRHLGRKTAERVHNDDLFLSCAGEFPAWRHFLVGGAAGQAEAAAEALRKRFPGIAVVGVHATPARPVPVEETAAILAEIRAAKPDIVWVGMGTPSQDHWMAETAAGARVPMVACGSLFDILSGRTSPAPAWMKRNGLQWLFRLIQEPRRLLFRYSWFNLRFIAAIAPQLLKHKVRSLQASAHSKAAGGAP